MKPSFFFTSALTICLLLGNSPSYAKDPEINNINLCIGGQCQLAEQLYNKETLLNQFQQLLKANEGLQVNFCKAENRDNKCTTAKVCHFVLGGIIPGNGCSQGMTFKEPELNPQSAEITMKADMPLTFIGTPLVCTTAASSVSVRSMNDMTLELKSHFCSWMAVGAMSAKFNIRIDSINFDKGEIGGYWKHSVKGTGMGSGSGYVVLQFPNNIPTQATSAATDQASVQQTLPAALH